MKGSATDSGSTAKGQVASGKALEKVASQQAPEGGAGDNKASQKGQGDKTAQGGTQEGKEPASGVKMAKSDTGGAQGPKDINQLRQDIQRTLKSIDYDLKRIKSTTKETTASSQASSPASGKQEQKASQGEGPQPALNQDGSGPGQDKALEEQTAMDVEGAGAPGGPQGEEMEVAQQGQGTSAAGTEAGREKGYSPREGTETRGMGAGSKPGDKLFSEKEEEMGPPGERGLELRLKADKATAEGKREVLSTGQEVVEGAVPFKQHSPTVEVDPQARLGKEQAGEDAIKKTRIPQEYEEIVKEIYKGNN